MPKNESKLHAARILVTAGMVVILVAGLKLAQGFFVPLLLAGFIAPVSLPITSWLRSRRVPRAIAVLLTVLVDFAFLTGIVIIVVALTGDLETKWQDKYYPAMNLKIEEISETAVEVLEKWKCGNMPPFAFPNSLEKVLIRLISERMWPSGWSPFWGRPF